jgi:outer membrane biosynthesis protein TonB
MSAHIRGDLAGLVDAADTSSSEGEQSAQAETAPVVQAVPDEPAAPAAAKKTRSPRKKGASTPAKTPAKTTAKTTAKKAPAKKAAATKPAPEPLRVLAANAGDAQRVSLYLHPDDYEFLKYENRIEINKLVRTMIAVYRHNERFRNTVDRAVKTAPRGGM